LKAEDPAEGLIMPVPWSVKEEGILSAVRRRATALMWLGYLVYAAGCGAAFLVFGDKPGAVMTIMILQFAMVIWMGTKAMFQNMSAVLRLSIETNREMMPTFEKIARAAEKVEDGSHPAVTRAQECLNEAVLHMKAIRDAIERQTKPLGNGTPARREPQKIVG
jgi:hypothetical protein